ncbi:hypothetical protein [Streptomyces sp. KL116D]|uniref:hypothetical protein n=1 Tax=Streptomyces sp. KL116D TaxID=3045152 RepID=UPI003558EB40
MRSRRCVQLGEAFAGFLARRVAGSGGARTWSPYAHGWVSWRPSAWPPWWRGEPDPARRRRPRHRRPLYGTRDGTLALLEVNAFLVAAL